MNAAKLKTIQNADEELDDPNVDTMSTEKFVENMERIRHEEKNE